MTPRDLQESSGCVIGQDYPAPLVDHRQQRVVCVQRLRDLAFKLSATKWLFHEADIKWLCAEKIKSIWKQ